MSDAKPLTTKDVDALHVVTEYEGESTLLVDRDDLLATTRALETAQAELLHVHDALHRECTGKADLPGEIRALRTRVEKAERERDAAKSRDWPCLDCQPESPEKAGLKTLVAELVTALDACAEWMRANPPVNGWGLLNKSAEADCSDVLAVADAALAKAKGATNG